MRRTPGAPMRVPRVPYDMIRRSDVRLPSTATMLLAAVLLAACGGSSRATTSDESAGGAQPIHVDFSLEPPANRSAIPIATPSASGITVTGKVVVGGCAKASASAERTGGVVRLRVVVKRTPPPAGSVCPALVALYGYRAALSLPAGEYHLVVDYDVPENEVNGAGVLTKDVVIP